jgi:hypothetical protein
VDERGGKEDSEGGCGILRTIAEAEISHRSGFPFSTKSRVESETEQETIPFNLNLILKDDSSDF